MRLNDISVTGQVPCLVPLTHNKPTHAVVRKHIADEASLTDQHGEGVFTKESM